MYVGCTTNYRDIFIQIVTDNQLFVMVFVLLAIDVVILAVWQIVDPLQVGVKDLLERVSKKGMKIYINISTHDFVQSHYEHNEVIKL